MLAKELCKRLPAEMQGDIDAARTLRGLTLHVHAKRIDIYFKGEGLEKPRAIKIKDMAMNERHYHARDWICFRVLPGHVESSRVVP